MASLLPSQPNKSPTQYRVITQLIFRKSHLITQAEFAAMQLGASVLEQDERGVKVLLLADGNILKIFRLRGIFTSSQLYSNARSFCRNAERLLKLGIPTISIIQLYHFAESSNTAVLYLPLAGDTIKTILQRESTHDGNLQDEDCIKLGQFIANLHQFGIHFKSLHFGNIVRTPAGDLGLIDIADMRVFLWRLHFNTRVRSFKRLVRYKDDMKLLGFSRLELLLKSYLIAANMPTEKQGIMLQKITQLIK